MASASAGLPTATWLKRMADAACNAPTTAPLARKLPFKIPSRQPSIPIDPTDEADGDMEDFSELDARVVS